jgi:hypothetical protein
MIKLLEDCMKLFNAFTLFALLLLLLAPSVFAFNPSSITFAIPTSAVTSTPNVRIGVVKTGVAWDVNRGVMLQGMPLPDSVTTYYLTKSSTYTPEEGTMLLEIQTDQNTKMYLGSDLTNFLYIYSGVPRIYTIRK